MRAKASTPASANLSTLALCLVASACAGGDLACPRLQQELREVQRDGGVRRSSLWVERGTAGDSAVVMIVEEESGDFPYFHSAQTTRECLGSAWTEAREEVAVAGWETSAIRFSRSSWPDVLVFEDETGNQFGAEGEQFTRRTRIVIEGRDTRLSPHP